jgi:hypothetical protein
MNPTVIAGLVVFLVGSLVASDYKGLGMRDPALGILVAGAGFFIAVFGFFSGDKSGNESGPRKKVKDYSV